MSNAKSITSKSQTSFKSLNYEKFYQLLRTLKHQTLFSLFGSSFSCHQTPSCSRYTIMQIKKNGTIVGLSQGLWRSVNCHHF